MRVFILTSRTPGNIWLVNQIMARHEVVGMAIEAPPLALSGEDKRARRRRMIDKHGYARTLNKLIYNWFRSRVLSRFDGDAAREYFFPGIANMVYLREVPTVTVPNINDAACIALIRQQAPDVIAVCGTNVIRPEVFTLAPRGAINIHTGITPEYRSADPIFWALYNREPDKVGVTVHFVDRGIDTGPIIHQERVPLYGGDTLARISARCVRHGAALYLRALEEIEHGIVRTLNRAGVKGRAYYSINLGILQYLRFRGRFRKLKRGLPLETQDSATPVAEAHR